MSEPTTMKKLWISREWLEFTKAYVEGNPCKWSRSAQGDTYTDDQGKPQRIGLSYHHIETHRWSLSIYNQVRDREYSFNPCFSGSASRTIGPSLSSRVP